MSRKLNRSQSGNLKIFCASTLILSLVSCGNGNTDSEGKSGSNTMQTKNASAHSMFQNLPAGRDVPLNATDEAKCQRAKFAKNVAYIIDSMKLSFFDGITLKFDQYTDYCPKTFYSAS